MVVLQPVPVNIIQNFQKCFLICKQLEEIKEKKKKKTDYLIVVNS